MLELPTLGLQILDNVEFSFAQTCDDGADLDRVCLTIDACRGLLRKNRLSIALTKTSQGFNDKVRREKDVVHSLMEVEIVKGMME